LVAFRVLQVHPEGMEETAAAQEERPEAEAFHGRREAHLEA